LLCATLLAGTVPAQAQDTGALQRTVDRKRSQEHRLSSAAARLGQLERSAAHDVAALQARLSDKQADLDSWTARLTATQKHLRSERRHLERLRLRLNDGRATLARLLRERYMAVRPDLIDVIFGAHGFAELLERITFLDRVKDNDASVLYDVRHARNETRSATEALARLEPAQRTQTEAVRRQRDALAAIGVVLQQRQSALAQARAARLAALHATRAGRLRAQRTLRKLIAERSRAATSLIGPGGPWAIPWAIVQCESGGQNLPPNGAGASGYYQFLPSTWKGLGGSTPNAYQASKTEQDRLAARLWDGGRGAHNWVCAGIVGIT
jgi:peptidoglycan hydrolase CwlO-like protein